MRRMKECIEEAGINVHDVLPVTTPRGKQMMPPADRICDPGQGAKKDQNNENAA